MKKINGKYVLSATDKKRTQQHCNGIARRAAYEGSVDAYLNTDTGDISYIENVGLAYTVASEPYEYICTAYTPVRA